MSFARPLSAFFVASLGAVVFLAPIADVEAGMRCGVGKPNHDTGMCDCPAGYRSVGTEGNSECELVARPKPATTTTTTTAPAKSATDFGATVTVKGGVFKMGSDDAALAHAGPAHVVTMGDVEIDKYEVTVDEYKKCVDGGICATPPDKLPTMLHAERCNWGASGRGNHPMNCVTWQEAVNYCAFKSKRLPSEAEWEYAARGGVATHKYPWGTTEPSCTLANYSATPDAPTAGCGDGTSPVGAHAAGATSQGVHDLAGNVEEWVADYFAGYTAAPASNPGGPSTGTQRVAKGSSWDLDKVPELDVARREGMDPTHRANWLGFRCVKGAAPATNPALYTPIAPPAPPVEKASPTSTPKPAATSTPTEVATASPASTSAAPTDLGTMVHIPSATFSMGDAIEPLATPVHAVTLGPYSIDKYEVTVGQYRTCVNAGACAAPVQTSATAVCNWSKPGRDAHPINCVTWQEAKAFCGFAGKRLPSEAEWEYAARGGTQRWYPWGNDAPTCSRATFTPKGGPQCSAGTSPVGSHPGSASPFGLFDMAGNVEEWVWDVYAPYSSAAQVNPFGPTKAGKHVIRGGNWNYDLAALRTFARWYTDAAGDYIGFRCAKSG